MTEKEINYGNCRVFKENLEGLGITHKRNRVYRTQNNGKEERFNRTLLEEFAYKQLLLTNEAR